MDTLSERLARFRNSEALLFCGAGLTAECLNFDDDPALGVTSQLLNILNEDLRSAGKGFGFSDIRNAATQYKRHLGNHKLMERLKSRFKISRISSSIQQIALFPWASIYTTNYDNGIELALQQSGKRYTSINNVDGPDELVAGTRVVHLHGFAEAWTDKNFEASCVLGTASYYELTSVKKWLERLRYDIERARLVVFVGFSSADFHLNQVFHNSTGLREKAFFVNRPSANPSADERAIQEEFGRPLYIGRDALAEIATQALKESLPKEPRLASFRRLEVYNASVTVPPVQDIEDLFIWGVVNRHHLKRDQNLRRSDYHVLRHETLELQQHLTSPGSLVFLRGDICDEKPLLSQTS